MKKLFITILLFAFTFSSNAQGKIKFIDSISYNQIEKLFGRKQFKNVIELNAYKTKNGDWIELGDTLEIGRPYNSGNLAVSQINGMRNANNEHSHILLGTNAALMTGTAFFGDESMIGDKIFITELRLDRESKKNLHEAYIKFNKVGGGRFRSIKKLGRANLEDALRDFEIINGDRRLTRKEAIAKLKEAKDLMEIDMMTKEEFVKLKKELAPIIMNKS